MECPDFKNISHNVICSGLKTLSKRRLCSTTVVVVVQFKSSVLTRSEKSFFRTLKKLEMKVTTSAIASFEIATRCFAALCRQFRQPLQRICDISVGKRVRTI